MNYCEDNRCIILSSGSTAAMENVDHYEKDSHVSIPTIESVEIAKEWIESNEK